ncbi:hypothetical protein M9Y10_018339 [Tritrichomonas musculus]|uniref:Myb-like DNA-binding domain containing protein n=1 Tax=Tritrichomonas musculus TaxID=1915356 RepID=A0ABR2HNR6_9EUKA
MKKKQPKKQFSFEEDKMLKKAVSDIGENNWDKVSKLIPNRTPRQCRDRWNKYLSPNISGLMWTDEEDQLLLSLINNFGNKWTKIASFFKGRSDINIRNRYKHLLSKDSNLVSSSTDNIYVLSSTDSNDLINSENKIFDKIDEIKEETDQKSKNLVNPIIIDPIIVKNAAIYNENATKQIGDILNSLEPCNFYMSSIKM